MKVLVISQHFWPETMPINDLANDLHAAGIDLTILTGQPNYPAGKVFSGYRALNVMTERHPAGYPIQRVPLTPRGSGSGWRLAVNYLSFIASTCLLGPLLFRGRRFDVIFVFGSSPILQALAGIALKRQVGAALVTWVQDLWPQSLEATGFVRNRRILRVVGLVVGWIYRRTDLLLVQSRAFLDPVRRMAGATPVIYHPNPGDAASEALVGNDNGLRLESGFTVLFAGNLGTVQALDTILDAAEQVRHAADIRFVLVGSGSRGEWLRGEIQRRGLTNVTVPGRFPPAAMSALFAQASALLVSLNRNPILSLTIPSKVQTYLAAGRPIIAALDGEGARVVVEAGAGIACPAEDPVALAAAVLTLRAASPAEREFMGAAGRAYHARHFSSAMLTERLIGHFRTVAARRPRWACAN